jgi:hypothetical protein
MMLKELSRPIHPEIVSALIQMELHIHGEFNGLKKQDVLRISINDDESFDITDFTLPSESGKVRKNVPQEDMPQWVLESISMLRIADINSLVKEVGFKINDRLYFIQDRRGG